MARAQKEWARRKRAELMALLGNVCAHCGATDGLEFDCLRPKGDAHHRGEASQRMCFYRRQFREGNLQVLCSECNGRKGDSEPGLVLTAPLSENENKPF